MSQAQSVPLVLLPGMGCSPALWDAVLPQLRAALPDLQIRTPEPVERSLDACADALLEALPARFALAGLSLGGIVAMAVARRAAVRITGLCLMSTNHQVPTAAQCDGWATQRYRLTQGAHARDLQRDLLPVLLSKGQSAVIQERVLSMADDIGDATFDAQLALQSTRQDERPGLPRISVPSLVIAAELDELCPPEWHEDMAQRIPGARLVHVRGVGHLSPLEAPDAVADAMIPWVRESCGPAARG